MYTPIKVGAYAIFDTLIFVNRIPYTKSTVRNIVNIKFMCKGSSRTAFNL